MSISAFTWSTSGVEHGSCSTVHGPTFPDSTAEKATKTSPASHQESRDLREAGWTGGKTPKITFLMTAVMSITNKDIQLLPQIEARQHHQPDHPITMRRSVSESQVFLRRHPMSWLYATL